MYLEDKMRISAKAKYGLSAMICLAQRYNTGEYITVISLSTRLKISKIYLEQVFSLLKRAKLVILQRDLKAVTSLQKNRSKLWHLIFCLR
jgi:DNA-binding IscR family transcriptional regulator